LRLIFKAILWSESQKTMAKTKNPGDPGLRMIPSIDQLLKTETALELSAELGLKRVTALARLVTAELRNAARDGSSARSPETLLTEATNRLREVATEESRQGIRSVINATGVVLHTNLGRAPLSESARNAVNEAAGYCTLEYDATSGTRGKRGARVESLLRDLTGAEDALVVNNCAAAALLILSVLAGEGETIVSRGELVEIGGDFRVPDVMASSGTKMVEVGTTNKTHLDDYRKAITAKTRLLMRVHPSNYRVIGFASSPKLEELVALGKEAMIPLYEDAGSGQLFDLSEAGIEGEPVVSDLVAGGADLISFSGDKLLGSIQAGLIVGRRGLVDRLRRHPLYRALRSDKIRLAALEATLSSLQRDGTEAQTPVLRMLSQTRDEISKRADSIIAQVRNPKIAISKDDGVSAVGGGAGPTAQLPSVLLALQHETLSAQDIEARLRLAPTPVIARISEQRVVLDLRTVFAEHEAVIVGLLNDL
jgi:L-seryl-tRNA(Ser) seleniumtransferase